MLGAHLSHSSAPLFFFMLSFFFLCIHFVIRCLYFPRLLHRYRYYAWCRLLASVVVIEKAYAARSEHTIFQERTKMAVKPKATSYDT